MKKLIPYLAAVLIAAGAFVSGAVTDFGEAYKIVTDKQAALEYCGKILEVEKPVE